MVGSSARREAYTADRNPSEGFGKGFIRATYAQDKGRATIEIGAIGKGYPKGKGTFTARSREIF